LIGHDSPPKSDDGPPAALSQQLKFVVQWGNGFNAEFERWKFLTVRVTRRQEEKYLYWWINLEAPLGFQI